MVHYIECDNCGKSYKVGCFETSEEFVVYLTPPMPKLSGQYTVGEYLEMLTARAETTLCKDCVSQ